MMRTAEQVGDRMGLGRPISQGSAKLYLSLKSVMS